MSSLNEWDSFYVIVGSAAGALIGLQFVVMTLVAERPTSGSSEAGRAFGTPTVVHFSASLLLSALVRVPWSQALYAIWAAGAVGACGVVYIAVVALRMWQQNVYKPDLEDVTFHILLPFIAYGSLVLSGALARTGMETALFGTGGAVLLLLFIGIHNAWDAVAYHVYVQRIKQAESSKA